MKQIIEHWINIYKTSIKNSPMKLQGKELVRFVDKQEKHILTLELLKIGIISDDGVYALITNMRERVVKANNILNNPLNDDEREFVLSDIDKSNYTIKSLEKIIL